MVYKSKEPFLSISRGNSANTKKGLKKHDTGLQVNPILTHTKYNMIQLGYILPQFT